MELEELIYEFYKNVSKDILLMIPNRVKTICEIQAIERTNAFTVTLEIILQDVVNEHDNGITFSTNAQEKSHYNSNTFANGLYLITDLSAGNGDVIAETNEVNYLPLDHANNKQILENIKSFTTSKINLVTGILFERYGFKA